MNLQASFPLQTSCKHQQMFFLSAAHGIADELLGNVACSFMKVHFTMEREKHHNLSSYFITIKKRDYFMFLNFS